MVHVAPGGHFGICGLLPQGVLKREVHVDASGSTEARSYADVPAQKYLVCAEVRRHVDVCGLCCQQGT